MKARKAEAGQTKSGYASGLADLPERDRLLSALLPAKVEGSYSLHRAHIVKAALDNRDWTNLAEAPHSALPDDISTWLQKPPLRQFNYKITSKPAVSVGLTNFTSSTSQTIWEKAGSSGVSVDLFSITAALAAVVAPTYAQLMERIPKDRSQGTGNRAARGAVFRFAMYYHYPNHLCIVPVIKTLGEGSKTTYK